MRSFYRKRKMIFILLIVVGILSLSSVTYAIFTVTTSQSGTNEISTMKCLELAFSNQENNINLVNTYPMTDERGAKNTPYTFTITNNCEAYIEYSIGLMIDEANTLEDKYVKTMFSLKDDIGEAMLLTNREEGKVYNDNKTYLFRRDGLANGASKEYKLRLWVDGSGTAETVTNKSFNSKIIINAYPKSEEGKIIISADLDGGHLYQELNEVYREGDKVKLPIPAKEGHSFKAWEIVSGDGTVEGNTLTVGKMNTVLKATYKAGITVTLDLGGGTTTQKLNNYYYEGDTITLTEPQISGCTFGSWLITSGDATIENNTLTINKTSVVVKAIYQGSWNYNYAGDYQKFIAPVSNTYKIELWGAQGGGTSEYPGGKGAYTSGYIDLEKGETIYIYVGGSGTLNSATSGGYNGGGSGSYQDIDPNATINKFGGGGGATDIRLKSGAWDNATSLNSRIMVAGGGGGSFIYSVMYSALGAGGGTLAGEDGDYLRGECSTTNETYHFATGGMQNSGGISANGYTPYFDGSFGKGGNGATGVGTGGGGGYYGGGGTGNRACSSQGGGGGSSFISGYAGANAITSETDRTPTNQTIHYSSKYFINAKMESGVNTGNGKAKITIETPPKKTNTKLNNVRYIKDCINGVQNDGSWLEYNTWIELQAMKNGINLALNKNVLYTTASIDIEPYYNIVDGNIDGTNLNQRGTSNGFGEQCITVDLENTYNLDEIVIWHFWQYLTGATSHLYYNNTTYVSSDNVNWTNVTMKSQVETSNGRRISAYENTLAANSYTITNLFENSSFEAEISGITNTNYTNFSSLNGLTRYTSTISKYGLSSILNYHADQYSAVYSIWHDTWNNIPAIPNHIYYHSVWINNVSFGNDNNNYFHLGFYYDNADHWADWGSSAISLRNWQLVSALSQAPAVSSRIALAIADSSSTNHGQWFFSDGLMVIDLTATFGAGNEPTKEWCDENIPYFTGTISLKLNNS